MSKIVCDICGTQYDDSVGSCPVCGWDQKGDLPTDIGDFDSDFLDDLQTDIPVPGAAPAKPVAPKIPSAAPKAKTAFDYDAANARTRPAPKKTAPAVEDEDDDEDEDEEEESGSNVFLIIILVLLILALLAVSAYIGWTKILKPRQAGSDNNKPQETITAEVETTAPTISNTEYTEETEPGVPCTGLSLVGSMEKLTFKGQYWRLMVKAEPEDTTDKVVYTSGDESIVTIDEYGRVTAVGEGETTIVVTCGNERLETPAVVSFQTETTEAATEATSAAEGTATTPTAAGGNTGSSTTTAGNVLKLKKTDVTIGRRGVYITLELEGGIVADDVRWSTSDSSVATVYNGNVTAIGKGTCIITAEYNGQTAQCIVRCKF